MDTTSLGPDRGGAFEAAGAPALPGAPDPLSFFASAGAVFRNTAFSPLRGRRGWTLALLAWMPVVILLVTSLIIETPRGGGSRFFLINTVPAYHYIQMLVFIFLGCSVLGDSVDDRTIIYNLICPISRLSIFAGSYLAYLVSTFIIVIPALGAVYFTSMSRYGIESVLHSLPLLWAVLAAAVVGAMVYGSFCILLSLITRRAVLVVLFITICIEGVVANIPFRIGTCSVLYHLRNLMANISGDEGFFPVPDLLSRSAEVSLSHSVTVLGLLWLVFTLAAAMLFKRKQFPS